MAFPMNKTIGSIAEFSDRFEVMNIHEAVLNTLYRQDMTATQVRMITRLINRFVSDTFKTEQWIGTDSAGYFEDCTLHMLSDRRRSFCRRGCDKARGV